MSTTPYPEFVTTSNQAANDAALRADIRELGRILGEVIQDQWGREFFDLGESRTTVEQVPQVKF